MPILVNRFQINDPMPTLGQLVREAIQPEPCKFRAFEAAPHRHDIKEHECRQIKGAAQGSNAEKVGTARPSPVAAPPSAWIDCSPDMPDLPAGRYEVRYECGEVYRPKNMRLHNFHRAVSYQPRQYREVQS